MALKLKYFVLKPRGRYIHAIASRKAMKTYAKIIADEDPEMSAELFSWVEIEENLLDNLVH